MIFRDDLPDLRATDLFSFDQDNGLGQPVYFGSQPLDAAVRFGSKKTYNDQQKIDDKEQRRSSSFCEPGVCKHSQLSQAFLLNWLSNLYAARKVNHSLIACQEKYLQAPQRIFQIRMPLS